MAIISNSTSLHVGDTVLLTCVGFGQLQPVEITWRKNGADIMNSSSTTIYEEEIIAEGGRTFKMSTLVLCSLQGSGAGGYNCMVSNQTTMTHCAPGYSGTRCETDLDFCMLSTCENGGTCEEGPGVSTRCDCMPGFTGSSCSIRLPLCQAEQESSWMLNYPETEPGQTIEHNCSAIYNDASGIIGMLINTFVIQDLG